MVRVASQDAPRPEGDRSSSGTGGYPRRPRRSVGALVAVLVAALVLILALALPRFLGDRPQDPGAEPEAVDTSGDPATPTPTATPVKLPGSTVTAIDGVLDGAPAQNTGAVVADPATGDLLYERNPDQPVTPASNQKILTELSLVHHADVEDRLATTVVAGKTPSSVVLVAGGDTLLSPGESNPKAVMGHAGVATLAEETARSMARETDRDDFPDRIEVDLDTSVFEGPATNDAWLPGDVAAGEVGPVAPMAFGSHTVPGPDGRPTDTHDDDAARTVAEVFAGELSTELSERTGQPVSVEVGQPVKAAEGRELGRVESATLEEQATVMMQDSDNRLAEVLGRMAAVKSGHPGSVQGARKATEEALREALGRDVTAEDGVVVGDNCGMAPTNRVTARVLAGILLLGEQDAPNRYTPMISTFPVSGDSGTLEDRFDDPTEAAGRGVVRAKTGTLNTVTALSGRVTRDDGERMIAVVLFDGVQETGVARNRADEFFATLAQS